MQRVNYRVLGSPAHCSAVAEAAYLGDCFHVRQWTNGSLMSTCFVSAHMESTDVVRACVCVCVCAHVQRVMDGCELPDLSAGF